jgi:hypothetical protein
MSAAPFFLPPDLDDQGTIQAERRDRGSPYGRFSVNDAVKPVEV